MAKEHNMGDLWLLQVIAKIKTDEGRALHEKAKRHVMQAHSISDDLRREMAAIIKAQGVALGLIEQEIADRL